ncbi:MAG: glucose-6-phosphate dehydrogenase, partial [Saprospiraceae bacterium]
YRIDHYLGKETVQNLLVTRFANGIFEPLWNRNYIQHVQITNAENLTVGSRGGYYDKSGALRDMFQNHLMQIVAHIAMEPPIAATATAIRNEKLKLLQSIRPIREEDVSKQVIRGQYTKSTINGKNIAGYRQEEGVPDDSRTETFVALKFFIDNWRWADVPFYVRSGKALPTKATEVVITFKDPPNALFRKETMVYNDNNQLIIRIQPNEGLLLKFGMKIPGAGFEVKDVSMDFHYSDLTNAHVPAAYERLLLDVIKGDATLYARGDSVEEAWRFVQPILNAWEKNPKIKVYGYPAGTWGPPIVAKLIEAEDLTWRNPCNELTTGGDFQEL